MIAKFLTIIAAILAIFGLLYLFSPQTLALHAGIEATPSGLTDIRATYGGFQIGFALFLFWSSRREQHHGNALMATALVFASVGLGRLYGIIVDGDISTFNLIGLAFETVLTALCLTFYNRIGK